MSKGGSQVQETPQQKAMTEHAMNVLQDYRARWLPVQQRLAQQVQAMGAPGSTVREQAAGRAGVDTAMKFAGAENAIEKTAANTVGLGSSRAKLGITGVSEDAAQSKGLGLTAADQRVDDAYTQALGSLAAVGRGDSATVLNSLENSAAASARQAQADADASLQGRMGTAGLVGQVAGFGLQQGIKNGFGAPGGGSPLAWSQPDTSGMYPSPQAGP